MVRGTTWDQFGNKIGDNSHLFRKQDSRSLEEIDILISRLEHFRRQLGPERTAEIEQNPDLFYNHEKFRIWQAKARFRAFLTTLVAYPIICVQLAGKHQGGWNWAKSKPLVSVPIFVGLFTGSFFSWHRFVGYNRQAVLEQNFSKNFKMLRNV
jgi:hypothetical protein